MASIVRRTGGACICLLALGASLAPVPGARAQDFALRREQAVELCARELSRRADGRRVVLEHLVEADNRRDRVEVDALMRVQRSGDDPTLRIGCVVDFSGSNRVVAFSVDGQDGGQASGPIHERACLQAAERAGYRVRGITDTRQASGGMDVLLSAEVSGRRTEVLCLFTDRGGVRGLYERRA